MCRYIYFFGGGVDFVFYVWEVWEKIVFWGIYL